VPWDAPLAVATPAALPGALTGSPWSTILAAAGGQPPYRWQLMPGYTEHAGTAGVLVPGTARDWRSANQAQTWTWTRSQGFRFPMVAPGRQVEAVRVVVRPGGTVAFPDLPGQREIAVFGTALATDGIGEDIFTRETPGRADIRWRAHPVGVTGADGSVEVQLSLFADGDVLMTWGRVAGPAATMQRRVGIRAAPSSVDDVQVIGAWNGTAAIPDGSTARFTALAPPAGIRLDPLTGTLSGTPASSGSRAFTVRVADAAVLAQWADRTFTVATADAGAGPRLGDPAPVVVRVGMAPAFTVAWAGSPAPAIRWESAPPDGPWSTLPGATGPTLVLPAATRDQDGLRVRAVATQGSVTAVSGPARLTVRAAGDADLDGMVDVVDLVHVRRGVITGDTSADLDRDGAVTGADRLPVRQDFTR
jgi:hypothetical protein